MGASGPLLQRCRSFWVPCRPVTCSPRGGTGYSRIPRKPGDGEYPPGVLMGHGLRRSALEPAVRVSSDTGWGLCRQWGLWVPSCSRPGWCWAGSGVSGKAASCQPCVVISDPAERDISGQLCARSLASLQMCVNHRDLRRGSLYIGLRGFPQRLWGRIGRGAR